MESRNTVPICGAVCVQQDVSPQSNGVSTSHLTRLAMPESAQVYVPGSVPTSLVPGQPSHLVSQNTLPVPMLHKPADDDPTQSDQNDDAVVWPEMAVEILYAAHSYDRLKQSVT